MAEEKIEMLSGSRERVAFDLMRYIVSREGVVNFEDRKDVLKLYVQCRDATSGVGFDGLKLD